MLGKTDNSINKESKDEQFTKAYQQFQRPLDNLFSMIKNSTHKAQQDERKEIVRAMDDRLQFFSQFLPSQSVENESFEFKDTAEQMKYTRMWFIDQVELSDEDAIRETHEFKLSLQDDENGFNLNQFVEQLISLAPDEYETTLTKLHCTELVEAYNAYKKLLVIHYYNNDPYTVCEDLNKGFHKIAEQLHINLSNQDFLEETILKMAGVTTQPQKCRFNCNGIESMFISYRGISEADADKFLSYLRETIQDDKASYQFVPADTSRDDGVHDGLDNVYRFTIDTAKAKEHLLPAFVAEATRIENEDTTTLNRYRESSAQRNRYYFHAQNEPKHELFSSTDSLTEANTIG